jgi:hypothetical protein
MTSMITSDTTQTITPGYKYQGLAVREPSAAVPPQQHTPRLPEHHTTSFPGTRLVAGLDTSSDYETTTVANILHTPAFDITISQRCCCCCCIFSSSHSLDETPLRCSSFWLI